MIQAMIKYFERSAVERIEDNSNDAARSLHCPLCVYTAVNTAKAKRRTKSWKTGETTLRKDGNSQVFDIALKKGGEKKKTKVSTRYSYLVTHPSTNPTEKGLTFLSGQHNSHSFVRVQDKVSKLTSCMDFRMIQAMIKYFERSAVERIVENSNDVSRNLHCHTLSSMCLHRC